MLAPVFGLHKANFRPLQDHACPNPSTLGFSKLNVTLNATLNANLGRCLASTSPGELESGSTLDQLCGFRCTRYIDLL
jgi:hypothetical protein